MLSKEKAMSISLYSEFTDLGQWEALVSMSPALKDNKRNIFQSSYQELALMSGDSAMGEVGDWGVGERGYNLLGHMAKNIWGIHVHMAWFDSKYTGYLALCHRWFLFLVWKWCLGKSESQRYMWQPQELYHSLSCNKQNYYLFNDLYVETYASISDIWKSCV